MNSIDRIALPAGCHLVMAPVKPQDAPNSLFDGCPEVMDTEAAAKALGIPERTLRELARNGEIRGFKIGSVWRFTRMSIREYVEKQELFLLERRYKNE